MTSPSLYTARILWRFRFPLSVVLLVLTVFAVGPLASLDVSNTMEVWYPEDDPELANYREFQATYGSDEIVVVAVRGEQRFDGDEGRELVGELTDSLLDVNGVATVTSLVTVPESLGEARGRLLSADGRTTALVVQTLAGEENEAKRHQLLLDIRDVANAFELENYLGGYGVVFDGLNEASTTGAATLIIYAHLLMVVLLFVLFRRPLPVVLTLIAVGIATTWTMALYAATGHQLNMVTMVLPTLVLVIGIADCLHVLRSVAAEDRNQRQEDRVINGVAGIIGPCCLMTVTTAAGFLGLTVSGLPVVEQLGWFGATGVLAAFATSMVLMTCGLTWRRFEPARQTSRLDSLAMGLFRLGSAKPVLTITIFGLLGLVSAYGITELDSDTDSIGYLKKSHVVRRDSDFIEAEIGAYVPVEFTVRASGELLSDEHLDAIWRWQRSVEEIEDIDWSWSLISAFGLPADTLPSTTGIESLERQLNRMRLLSPVAAAAMIHENEELRVSFGSRIMSARSVQALIADILARSDFPPGLTARPAGYSPLYTRIVDEIVTSQVRGFAAAIVLIVVLIGVAMRSWKRTLLALPANVTPVLFTLGLMGLTGIPLDVASATIASVILGLVVDDTVHLVRPYQADGTWHSLQIAAQKTGGTLMMTSLVLAGGFLVLGLAEIRSIAWFGVLTSFAVVVAILSDLTLLPALARLKRTWSAS